MGHVSSNTSVKTANGTPRCFSPAKWRNFTSNDILSESSATKQTNCKIRRRPRDTARYSPSLSVYTLSLGDRDLEDEATAIHYTPQYVSKCPEEDFANAPKSFQLEQVLHDVVTKQNDKGGTRYLDFSALLSATCTLQCRNHKEELQRTMRVRANGAMAFVKGVMHYL
jgi:hypothetical protein